MDATAISAARGVSAGRVRARHVVLTALYFGGFQAGMPLIGWLLGERLGPYVRAWTPWIAFVLLLGLGGKMLWEARDRTDDPEDVAEAVASDPYAVAVMLTLAVATSIDALAVGFTLPLLGAPLALSLVTIGVTTALLSVAGLYLGRRFGALLGRRLDALGGLILIGFGVKILVEGLTGG
ncbi:MAG: manganese efflux pump MntP family protein [Enhygromyxa sp.]